MDLKVTWESHLLGRFHLFHGGGKVGIASQMASVFKMHGCLVGTPRVEFVRLFAGPLVVLDAASARDLLIAAGFSPFQEKAGTGEPALEVWFCPLGRSSCDVFESSARAALESIKISDSLKNADSTDGAQGGAKRTLRCESFIFQSCISIRMP